jgi:hypothetical protein
VRQFRPSVLFLSLLIAFSGSALADTVSMNFLGPGSNNSGGVYTYPYQFSINGGAPVSLICDAYNNEVVVGETWQATVTSLLSGAQAGGGGLFAGQVLKYEAAGLIFKGILAGNIDANVGNWAIWGLFSSDAQSNWFYQNYGSAALANQYLWLALNSNASDFAGLVLYTPIPGTQSWNGSLPQEYIGWVNVPEPAEISMILLLAMASVCAFAFRKNLGLKLAIGQQA